MSTYSKFSGRPELFAASRLNAAMSSPSTVRRFGTAKTYSRTRESATTRTFDEVVSGKTPPIKAETKWGKTNFMAIREDQKSKLEVVSPDVKETKPRVDEDPFSFDTDEGRKASPTKPQRVVVTADAPRSVTKLPASRLVTQVRGGQAAHPPTSDESSLEGNSSLPGAIARPGKTYTRAQEGRMSTSGRQQLIMDQFMEVGKTVRTEAGIEVVYTTRPQSPRAAWQMPPTDSSTPKVPAVEESMKVRLPPPVSPSTEDSAKERASFSLDDDDDDGDDDDIFPARFRREPLKTYSGEIITPVNTPDSPPPSKKRKRVTGAPRGRRTSRYTDPTLIEEYRKRYEESHAHLRDQTAGMNNSTVVSSKQLRGTQGTTLVVVCKPKVEVPEKKDDVQTKYFKNVKKELDKADRNITESDPQGDVKEDETESEPSPVEAPITKSALASPQSSASTVSTPTRNLRVRFADQTDESSAPSSASSNASPSPVKKPRAAAVLAVNQRSKDKPSSQSSTASSAASASKTVSSESTNSVASRTRSGGRQYRIFKSRGPPTAPAASEKTKDDKEMEVADSPQMPELMPELTPEVPTMSDNSEATDNPPNITDEEEEEMDTSAAVSQESREEPPTTDSQSSKETISDAVPDSQKSGPSLETVDTPSPTQQGKSTDSRDTPSPSEMSDDSQELSQEMSSSQDNSQKEEGPSAPSAPRRFFKSKKSSSASNLQRKVFEKSPSKASYNARSWQMDQGEKEPEGSVKPAAQTKKPVTSDTRTKENVADAPKLTRKVHWPNRQHEEAYTSVRVNKEHKELFTVVHNVKQAHEVQESGETQDFMDDVEYLLDSLRDDKPSSIRSLSIIQLAGKCIMPAFRMHLRAHGTVTVIFSLLHDACSDPSLALSTAAMMFMLSRDRLNMDLDKESLHLMLKLNEVDMPRSNGQGTEEAAVVAAEEEDSTDLEKCRQRVKDLLVQLQKETNAKEIDLGFVSTGNLAMESLLSLTSRRAGEWFKEELRQLGGLDHFVETIHHCVSELKEDLGANFDKYLPSLKKLDRCLRVLENITFMNSDNQSYLIAYNRGLLISSTCRILQLCVCCLPTNPPSVFGEEYAKDQIGWTIFNTLLSILRVLLNITHDSEFGSTRVGEEEGLLDAVLACVVSTQWCVPSDQRFDLLVLSLGLLVNLMEHCVVNRRYLVEARVEARIKDDDEPTNMEAVDALVQLFLQREMAARQMEEAPDTPSQDTGSPNKSGEWRESDSGIEWIAKSAEKVKAAEKEQRNAREKEVATTPGGSSDEANQSGDGTEKPIDGASILEDEETFTKALHKAGKHMENSIVASYVGLLLGCLIKDNRKYVETVKQHLPDGSFEPMIKILKKFLSFMSLTTAVGTTDANSIQHVIETLEAC